MKKTPQDTIYNMLIDNTVLSSNMIYNPIQKIAERIASERAERLDNMLFQTIPKGLRFVKSRLILKLIFRAYRVQVVYVNHNKVEVWKSGALFGVIEYNK